MNDEARIGKAVEEAMAAIDRIGDPSGEYKMSKGEWLDFLEACTSELEVRAEATEQELANEDEDEDEDEDEEDDDELDENDDGLEPGDEG